MFIFSSTPGHQIRECGQLLDDHLGKPASKTRRLLTQYLRSQLGRPQTEGREDRSLFCSVPLLHLLFLILLKTELLDGSRLIKSICRHLASFLHDTQQDQCASRRTQLGNALPQEQVTACSL